MKATSLRILLLGVCLAAGLACIMPVPVPAPEPPTPAPDAPDKPGISPGNIPMREMAEPERFTLNFRDAYLIYDPQTGVLQITAEGNVLHYGGDWQVDKVHPYLFHFRLKSWKAFFWMVNTNTLKIVEIRNGNFGSPVHGGSSQALPFDVDRKGGGGMTTPQSIRITFPKSYMVYNPGNDVFQLQAEGRVLSYCGDWLRCKLRNNLYHFKQNHWDKFIWSVNTISKRAWRVRGVNGVCQSGGSEELLDIKVVVTR